MARGVGVDGPGEGARKRTADDEGAGAAGERVLSDSSDVVRRREAASALSFAPAAAMLLPVVAVVALLRREAVDGRYEIDWLPRWCPLGLKSDDDAVDTPLDNEPEAAVVGNDAMMSRTLGEPARPSCASARLLGVDEYEAVTMVGRETVGAAAGAREGEGVWAGEAVPEAPALDGVGDGLKVDAANPPDAGRYEMDWAARRCDPRAAAMGVAGLPPSSRSDESGSEAMMSLMLRGVLPTAAAGRPNPLLLVTETDWLARCLAVGQEEDGAGEGLTRGTAAVLDDAVPLGDSASAASSARAAAALVACRRETAADREAAAGSARSGWTSAREADALDRVDGGEGEAVLDARDDGGAEGA